MALINEKLPEYITRKFNNEIINNIYSYCGNTQYNIVLKQLKNIIDSKHSIIYNHRLININYNIVHFYKYILSKNNQKMYLNGIVDESYYKYDVNEHISCLINMDNRINNSDSNFYQWYYTPLIYSDTESESDDDIPDLEDNYLINDNEIF